MPRVLAPQVQNSFIGGLNTQATALAFPENAAVHSENVEYDENGRAYRRPELDVEGEFVVHHREELTSAPAYSEFVWDNVSGTGEVSFFVQQVGNKLMFFDVSNDINISPNKEVFELSLSTFATSAGLNAGALPCQYAITNGELVVVNGLCDPFVVKYSLQLNSFETTRVTIEVRDTRGLDSSFGITDRPSSTLTNLIANFPEHYYNLLNQGWYTTAGGSGPLQQWDAARSDMPSNADIVAYSRSSSTDAFGDTVLDAFGRPTTLAPRGRFILSLGIFDREQAVDDAGFTSVTLDGVTESASEILDIGGNADLGNFANDHRAFDGLTSASSSNCASVNGTASAAIQEVTYADHSTIFPPSATPSAAGGKSISDLLGATASSTDYFLLTQNSSTSVRYDNHYVGMEFENPIFVRDVTFTVLLEQIVGFSNQKLELRASNVRPNESTDGVVLDTLEQTDYTGPADGGPFNSGVNTAFPQPGNTYTLSYTGSTAYKYVWVAARIINGTNITGTRSYWYGFNVTERKATPSTTKFIGKDLGSARNLANIRVHPSTNLGFMSHTGSWKIDVYASNSNLANPKVGALVGSIQSTSDTTSQQVIPITTDTEYRYWWLNIYFNDDNYYSTGSNLIYVGEIRFFEETTLTAGGIESEITNGRPTAIAQMNSRIFYGGINSRVLSNNIYFTQVIEDDAYYGRCYQRNDPTSEQNAQLLATDGGEIKINDMGQLVKLIAYEGAMLAFASNGVWRIWNPQGPFSATSYRIDKISDIGTNAPESFALVDGIPHWWSDEGLFRIEYNPQFRSFNTQNISDPAIENFLFEVPANVRKYIKAEYDRKNKKIIWLYGNQLDTDEGRVYEYTNGLVYNVLTRAFYPLVFSQQDNPRIRGLTYMTDALRNNFGRIKFTCTFEEDTTQSYLTYLEFREENNEYYDYFNFSQEVGTKFLTADADGYITDASANVSSYYGDTDASASKTTTTSMYAGYTLDEPRAISMAAIQGKNDSGYTDDTNATVTATLYAKLGDVPTSGTDGTTLGTISFDYKTNETRKRIIVSEDNVTEWDHVWVVIETNGSNTTLYLRQFDVFYNDEEVQFDYPTEVVTGYAIPGNLNKFGQPHYVFVYLEEGEKVGCYFQGIYDFAKYDTGEANKWGITQQLYNTNQVGRVLNYRKMKVRGKGRAMQFRFTSEPGKGFVIVGWAVETTANQGV